MRESTGKRNIHTTVTAKVAAVYIQDQIELSPQFQIIAGLRYRWTDRLRIHPAVRRAAIGVAAVIAPWNFPLAILCGMTVAPVPSIEVGVPS